jgi:hypothetical protein
MKILLTVAALAEGATGVALLATPSTVTRLLFGAEIAGAGEIVGRVAGISLIALGVACWPGGAVTQALYGMLVYNLLATLCFIYVGLVGAWVGVLLWPAAAVHGVMTAALAWAWFSDRKLLLQ